MIGSEILELWQQHASSAFPEGYSINEINGTDLPFLDAEITGCIRRYVHHDAELDSSHVKILRERLIDLNTVILLLAGEKLVYFERLRKLANLVLEGAENR